MLRKALNYTFLTSMLCANLAMAQVADCVGQDLGVLREVTAGLYEVSGKGKTREQAVESALVSLSYGIHTKVRGECTDIEESDGDARGFQSCAMKVKTRSELGYTPIVSDLECGGTRVVTIRYDSRAIVDRIDVSELDLTPEDSGIIDETKEIPLAALLRNVRSGQLSFNFDAGNRIWTIRQATETIWLTSKSFLEQIYWKGCEQKASFQLVFGSGLVVSARDGQQIRVKLTNKENRHFASVWELSQVSGVERLGKDLNPESEVDNGIIELDFASSLVRELIFVLLLSDDRLPEPYSRKNFTLDQFLQEVVLNELVGGNGQFCAYTVYNNEAV